MAATTILFGPYDPWDGLVNVKTFNRTADPVQFFQELKVKYGVEIIENLNRRFLKDADHRYKIVTPSIISYIRYKNYEDRTPKTEKDQRRTKKGAHVIIEHESPESGTTVKYAFLLQDRIMGAFTIDYLEDKKKRAKYKKAKDISIDALFASSHDTEDDSNESFSWISIENVKIQVKQNSPDFYLHYFDKEADRSQSRNPSDMNEWLLDWIKNSSIFKKVPIIAIKNRYGVFKEFGLASFKQFNTQPIILRETNTQNQSITSEVNQSMFNIIVRNLVTLMKEYENTSSTLPKINKQIFTFFEQNNSMDPFDAVNALETEGRQQLLRNLFIVLYPDKLNVWARDLPNFKISQWDYYFAQYKEKFRIEKVAMNRGTKRKKFLANSRLFENTFMFVKGMDGTMTSSQASIVRVDDDHDSMPFIHHNIRLAEKMETTNTLKNWENESGIYDMFIPFKQSNFAEIMDLGTRVKEKTFEEQSIYSTKQIDAWRKGAATKTTTDTPDLSDAAAIQTDSSDDDDSDAAAIQTDSSDDDDKRDVADFLTPMYMNRTGDFDENLDSKQDAEAAGDSEANLDSEQDAKAAGDSVNEMVFDFYDDGSNTIEGINIEVDDLDTMEIENPDVDQDKSITKKFIHRMLEFWDQHEHALNYLRQSGRNFLIQTPLKQLFIFEEFFEDKPEIETEIEKQIREFLLAGIEDENGNDAAKVIVEILIEKVKFFRHASNDAKKKEIQNVIMTYYELLRSKYQSNLNHLYKTGHIVFNPDEFTVIDEQLKQMIAGEDIFEQIKVEFDESDFVDNKPLVVDTFTKYMDDQNFRNRYFVPTEKLKEIEDQKKVNIEQKTFTALRDTTIRLEQIKDLNQIETMTATTLDASTDRHNFDILVTLVYIMKNEEVSMDFDMNTSDTLAKLVSQVNKYFKEDSPTALDDDIASTKITVGTSDFFIFEGKKITDWTMTLFQLAREDQDHIQLQLISKSAGSKALIKSSKAKQIAYARVIQSVQSSNNENEILRIALTTDLDKVTPSMIRTEPITKIRAYLMKPIDPDRIITPKIFDNVTKFLILAFNEQIIPIIEWSLVELCVNWLCEVIEKNKSKRLPNFQEVHKQLMKIIRKREHNERRPYEEFGEVGRIKEIVKRKGAFGYIQPGLYDLVDLIESYIKTYLTDAANAANAGDT